MSLPPPAPPHAPTVLVTGAAKRLGREIALALAAAGWRVAVHYRDSLEDATKTVADCADLTPVTADFRCNFGNGTTVRNLLNQKVQNQNPDFLCHTQFKAALEAANTVLALSLRPLLQMVSVAPPKIPPSQDRPISASTLAITMLLSL